MKRFHHLHLPAALFLVSAVLSGVPGCRHFSSNEPTDAPIATPKSEPPERGSNWTVPGLNMKFVYIKPGKFEMGSESSQAESNEQPAHTVHITEPYWIGKYEVTERQFQRFLDQKDSGKTVYRNAYYVDRFRESLNKPAEQQYPIVWVSWEKAGRFCDWLTRREQEAGRLPEGYRYRLPTEAEWAYAAQGGHKAKDYLYSGSDNIDNVAWYSENSGGHRHKVGRKEPNELGIYDMSGNVWEWCLDTWHDHYKGAPADGSAWTRDGDSGYRVVRGGSYGNFFSGSSQCRISNRYYFAPASADSSNGFRVVLSCPQSKKEPAVTKTDTVQPETSSPREKKTKGDEQAIERSEPIDRRADGKESEETPESPVKGKPWTVPSCGMEFVYVAPGEFSMGSDSERMPKPSKPSHNVQITEGFWIGKYEVTQRLYKKVMGENPSEFPNKRNPVEQVSWKDAMTFCEKLTERERQADRLPEDYYYRLPTEAEWEYAAKGGSKGRDYRYSGADNIDKVAWYGTPAGHTHPVGRKNPNELGIFDMSGNVWEWCLDGYDRDFYSEEAATDPVNTANLAKRVYRGGGWGDSSHYCRPAYRSFAGAPDDTLNFVGFRVVLAAGVSE